MDGTSNLESYSIIFRNMMGDSAFPISSIVSHYDAAQANQDSVLVLLKELGLSDVLLMLSGGGTTSFDAYLRQPADDRRRASELAVFSSKHYASLQNLAILLALANVRATADTAAVSAAPESLVALHTLERLLLPLKRTRATMLGHDAARGRGDYAPASSLVQSASLSRRRRRRIRAIADMDRGKSVSSLLLSISSCLRLCDIAVHVLVVASRGNLRDESICASALETSNRLLSLAVLLPRDGKTSSSIRMALECGCLRVGTIVSEHVGIDPSDWLETASEILNGSERLHVALFAGMIRGSQLYTDAKLDEGSIVRAATALSTLLIALEKDRHDASVSGSVARQRTESQSAKGEPAEGASVLASPDNDREHAAALEFLGERVVAVEDDGHDVPPSVYASSSLGACDAYCEQASRSGSTLGLVLSFLSAASRQCSAEVLAETDVVRLLTPVAFDGDCFDSAATPSGTPRSEAQFPVDIFDSRSPSVSVNVGGSSLPGLQLASPMGSSRTTTGLEPGVASSGHANAHREVGALALDCLCLILANPSCSERSALLHGIRTAVEAATKLSSLSIVAKPFALEGASEAFGQGSRFADQVGLSKEELILWDSIEEFGDQAGKWIQCVALSDDESEALYSFLSSGICSAELVGRIMSTSSSDRANQVVVLAFLGRLLAGADYVSEKDQSPSAQMHYTLRYVCSFFTEPSALCLLKLVLDRVDDSISDGTNLPTVFSTPRWEALAVAALAEYGLIVLLKGVELANENLDSVLASFEESVCQGKCEFDFDSVPDWNVAIYEASSVEGDNLVCARAAPAIVEVCDQFTTVFAKFADGLTSSCWNAAVSWKVAGIRQALSKSSLERRYMLFAVRISLHASGLASLYRECSTARVERLGKASASISVGHSPVDDEPGDNGLMSKSAKALCHRPFSDLLCESRFWSNMPLSDISNLASAVLCSDDFVGLTKIIELDFAFFGASELFRSQSPSVSGLQSSDMEALISAVSTCMSLLGNNIESPAPTPSRSVLTQAPDYDDMVQNEARFADRGRRLVQYANASTLGNCSRMLCLVLESLGSFFESLSRQDPTIHVSRTVRYAVSLLNSLKEKDMMFASSVSLWIRKAFERATGVSDRKEVDFCCGVLVKGCCFAEIVANAGGSRKSMERFLALSEVDAECDDDVSRSVDHAAVSIVLSRAFYTSSTSCRSFVLDSIPEVLLDKVLADLLVPVGDSAVSVEAASRALTSLAASCRTNVLWAGAITDSLTRICCGDPCRSDTGVINGVINGTGLEEEQFCERLVQRSIGESVAMSAAVLDFIKALGTGVLKTLLETQTLKVENVALWRWSTKLYSAAIALLDRDGQKLEFEAYCRLVEFSFTAACLSEGGKCPDVGDAGVLCLLKKLSKIARKLATEANNSVESDVSFVGRKIFFIVETLDAVRNRILPENLQNDMQRRESGVTSSDGNASKLQLDFSTNVELNSRAAVADKLCTFSSTGSQFVEQHWYFCFTCGLKGSEGVCAVCALVCHAGHDLSYSRHSRFFCDCGAKASGGKGSHATSEELEVSSGRAAGESRPTPPIATVSAQESRGCLCLRPRSDSVSVSSSKASFFSVASELGPFAQEDNDCQPARRIASLFPDTIEVTSEGEGDSSGTSLLTSQSVCVSSARKLFSNPDFSSPLAEVVRCLLGRPYDSNPNQGVLPPAMFRAQASLPWEKSNDLYTQIDLGKVASFAGNRNADFDRVGALNTDRNLPVGTRVSVSPKLHLLAVAEVDKRIAVYRINSRPSLAAKDDAEVFSTAIAHYSLPFVALHVDFDCDFGGNGSRLAAAGERWVRVFALGENGNVVAQLDIPLGFSDPQGSGKNHVLRVQWLRSRGNSLLVVTRDFVKIFYLNEDVLSPAIFAPLDDTLPSEVVEREAKDTEQIEDAAVCHLRSDSGILYVLSTSGSILSAALCDTARGPVQLSSVGSIIAVGKGGKIPLAIGVSCSPSLLWVLTQDGSLLLWSPTSEKLSQYEGIFPKMTRLEMKQVPSYNSQIVMSIRSLAVTSSFSGLLIQEPDGRLLFSDSKNTLPGNAESHFVFPSGFQHGAPEVPLVGVVMEGGLLCFLAVLCGPYSFDMMPRHFGDTGADIFRSEVEELTAELRVEAFEQSRFGYQDGSILTYANPVPSVVGFFEASRPATADVAFDGDFQKAQVAPSNKGATMRSPALTRTSVTRKSLKNSKPGTVMKVRITCSGKNLAIVGVRVLIAASEITRSHTPGRIRICGRYVEWCESEVPSKRTIDVPLSVPESVQSPHETILEVFPRVESDGGQIANGVVMIDDLEVYVVQSQELALRKRKLESDLVAFNRRAMKDILQRRCADATLMSRSSSRSGSSGNPVDPWVRCVMVCLDMLSARNYDDFPGGLDVWSDVSLCRDLILHACQIIASAVGRSFDNLYDHNLGGCGKYWEHVVSDVNFVEDILPKLCEQTHRYMDLALLDPATSGELISVCVIEKSVFLLARVLQVSRESCHNCEERNPVTSLLSHELLESLCASLITSHRSDDIALVSRRKLCGNLVDVIFSFLVCGIREDKADDISRSHSQSFDNRRVFERCLVPLLTSPCAWMRVFSYRRVVDLFQNLPAPEEFEPGESSTVNFWFSFEHAMSEMNLRKGPHPAETKQNFPKGTSKEVEDDEHGQWTFKCDKCDDVCENVWWHCAECGDFDLCNVCVNLPLSEMPMPHEEDHILLRGMKDDIDATPAKDESVSSSVCLSAGRTFGLIVSSIMKVFRSACFVDGARLLESAELLHRVVSAPSTPPWRCVFLNALFDIEFGLVESLRFLVGKVEFDDLTYNSFLRSPSASGTCQGRQRLMYLESLQVLLRILASLQDVAAVPHILRSDIISMLSALLSRLLPALESDMATVRSSMRVVKSDGAQRVLAPGNGQDHATLSELKDSVDVPVNLLRSRSCSVVSSRASGVFGHGRTGWSFSPALEMVDCILDLTHSVFSSVAGLHFEKAKSCFDASHLCQLKYLGDKVGSNIVGPRDDNFSGLDSDLTTGSLGEYYVAVAEKAQSLLCLLHRGSVDGITGRMDHFVYDVNTTSLHSICSFENAEKTANSSAMGEDMIAVLADLWSVASVRPTGWQAFLHMQILKAQDGRVRWTTLSELYDTSVSHTGDVQLRALELIAAGTATLKDSETLRPGVIELHECLTADSMRRLNGITEITLSGGCRDELQKAGCSIVENVIEVYLTLGDFLSINAVGEIAASYVNNLSVASYHGKHLADLLHLAVSSSSDGSWLTGLGESLCHLVKDSTLLLSSHPNAHIYKSIASLTAMNGYYLEAEPCISCCEVAGDNAAISVVPLEALRAEVKFTDSAMHCRLGTRTSISGVLLKVTDPNRSRYVKRVDVFASARVVTDAAELKSADFVWDKLATLHLSPAQTEVIVDLDLPIVAANLMFEYVDFYDSVSTARSSMPAMSREGTAETSSNALVDSSSSRLQCPRCSRQVTDQFGICRSCGENSYQCRSCRNINYEVLDGFICNECGYCRHGRFEFSLSCAPAYDAEPVLCEADRKRAVAIIESEAEEVRLRGEELKKLRSTLIAALSTPPGSTSTLIEAEKTSSNTKESDPRSARPRPVGPAPTDSGVLGGAANVESLLRSLVGEEGDISLPVVINGDVEGFESMEMASSIRDLAGQIMRERAAGYGDDDDGDEVKDKSEPVVLPSDEPGPASQAGHLSVYISKLYGHDCKASFTAMSKRIRTLISTRKQLARFSATRSQYKSTRRRGGERVSQSGSDRRLNAATSKCFGCAQACILRCLPLLEVLVKQSKEVRSNLCSESLPLLLLRCGNLYESDSSRDTARRLIGSLAQDNPVVTTRICGEIERKLEFCIASFQSVDLRTAAQMELAVLEELATVEDSCWEIRLELVFKLLFLATNVALESAAVSEYIVFPCLRAASDLVLVPSVNVLPPRPDEDEDVVASKTSHGPGETSLTGPVTIDGALEKELVAPRLADPPPAAEKSDSVPLKAEPPKHRVDLAPNSLKEALVKDHELGLSSISFSKWRSGKQRFAAWKKSALARVDCTETESGNASVDEDSLRVDDCTSSLRKSFELWKLAAVSTKSQRPRLSVPDTPANESPSSGIDTTWAFRLILGATSAEVRRETCTLLETLCLGEEMLSLRLIDGLLDVSLGEAPSAGAMSVEYFDLLHRLLEPMSIRLYLVADGFLVRLAVLIEGEATRLLAGETIATTGGLHIDLSRGCVLMRLISLCRFLLDAIQTSAIQVRLRVLSACSQNGNVVASFVRAYLSIHRLVTTRTKITDECGISLREILSSSSYVFLKPAGEIVVSSCVSELKLAHAAGDGEAISSLLALLCEVLCPEKEEPSYSLVLEKVSTQEDFIRGSMTRDFYPSAEFDGPLMRHVKLKICQDLSLMSLIEDDAGDFGLELLVAGSLVSLDLPIAAVFEHVWRPSAEAQELQSVGLSRRVGLRRGRGAAVSARRGGSAGHAGPRSGNPPMIVMYRLSGLDGEATEPMVDSLPAAKKSQSDLEEEFKATAILSRVGGLSMILNLLSDVESWSDDAGVAVREPTLRLLRASCEVACNRAALASIPGAIGTLIGCVVSALNSGHESTTAVESAESLSIATERIISEHASGATVVSNDSAVADATAMNVLVRDEDFTNRFRVVLGHLAVVSSPIAEAALLHLLPYLMYRSLVAIELVSEQFVVDWSDIDASGPNRRAANQLATVLGAWPAGWNCDSLSSLLLKRGVADACVDFIEGKYPVPKEEHLETWKSSLESPGSCLALKVLRGLANVVLSHGEEELSVSRLRGVVAKERNVARLCLMEMAVSSSGVGSAAEELLETLCKDEDMGSAVAAERQVIRTARKTAAEASRRAALVATQVLPAATTELDGKEGFNRNTAPANSISLAMLMDVEDEIGPACVVCGDGFTSRPSDALGVYVFSRRVVIGWKGDVLPEIDVGDADEQLSRAWQRRSPFPSLAASPSLSDDSSSSRGRILERSRSAGSGNATQDHCFTNVSHFNPIHIGCHREAARSDRSTRQPRDEWEGAALRNSQTKCNNIYPVMPTALVSEHETLESSDASTANMISAAKNSYVAAVDFYFSRLGSLSRITLTHLSQSVHDLAESLARFGCGRSSVFAEHSQGGGPHSNVCLIPHMLQLVWHLLDSSDAKGDAEALAFVQKLSSALRGDTETGARELPLILALSLIFHSVDEWRELGEALLHERTSALDPFHEIPSLLRTFAFTHVVQTRLKRQSKSPALEWRRQLSARICREEKWLADVCIEIANVWETRVFKLETLESLAELFGNHEV